MAEYGIDRMAAAWDYPLAGAKLLLQSAGVRHGAKPDYSDQIAQPDQIYDRKLKEWQPRQN